jgi:hypothetical protein
VIFLIALAVRMIGNIPEFLLIYRVNLLFGMPDQAVFILSNEVLFNAARAFTSVGIVLMMTRKEGDDMFVPLVSIYETMGFAFAGTMGSVLMDFTDIQTKTKPCNMDNYWLLSLICSILFPLLILPCIFLLVPDFRVPGGKRKESRNAEL